MRDLVLLGSSIVLPPDPIPPHHRTKPKPKPKPKPSLLTSTSARLSPPISSLRSRHPLLSDVRWDLNNYSDLATKLVQDGRFDDFSTMAETLILSGVELSQLVELVSAGISGLLREGRVYCVVEVLRKVDKLGICPLELFDGSTLELLSKECRRILNCGQVEEVVELIEILDGFHFPVKKLLEPLDFIKICVNKRNPNLAVRYACILPHAQILFCTIIHEFGKKRDLGSALTAFEASKQKLIGPNMYCYRTMIDVCGLCSHYQKSRYIYEELLAQKITPNIYVFNSLMNVNVHDLSYTFNVYKNMQNLGVTADMASYNILLKACCVAGRVDLAQEIYREVQNLESNGMLKLDVFTYSTIIKVFADAKLWQMALKIKEDMLSAGVIPNTVTWSALISSCANAGITEQAIQLFKEMLLAGCEPNSQCYNILLHACVEACQYDRAFRLFQSWKDSRFQEISGGTGNGNTACGTDYYRAKALMDEMKTAGLSPNHISWSILIDICGGTGNIVGAVRHEKQLEDRPGHSNHNMLGPRVKINPNLVVVVDEDSQHIQEEILKTMREAGIKPDVVAYTTAIKYCVESKNLKIAFSLFAEMKRYQIQPNLVTYNTLLRARSRYGSLHEVQQCLAIYQHMRKAGYKSNDYYLKELIEEWCEGVIQDNNLNQSKFSSVNRADWGRPQSLLLEKVAAHLQKSVAESLAIDLQGLTQVEARIVVLAVLRMIKENYILGHPIKDDILIILGIKKVDANLVEHESPVKGAIIKLLQDELGLEVAFAGPKIALDKRINLGGPPGSDPDWQEALGRNRLPTELESSTRRPAVLQRFKVTRKSLDHWLQRRVGATRGNNYHLSQHVLVNAKGIAA
ncbi:Pentatricopeptide repeat-containing protein, chloroplastic [Vitis vinifera]|uniref:Pentatricopeptide repeat-containing protein, chloroplastic n=1 Tax=Vitis vinifera TaxID=29760 RepID=A0A438DWL1_VITVI|nr:Pentatricopeptide repeat-containing protein, chloroplastic [Vitis vinifera]